MTMIPHSIQDVSKDMGAPNIQDVGLLSEDRSMASVKEFWGLQYSSIVFMAYCNMTFCTIKHK